MRIHLLTAPVLALGLILAAAPLAAAVSSADQAFFNSHINQLITLKPKPLSSPALAKISDARFYTVDVVMSDGGTSLEVARIKDDLFAITLPSTTAPMPDFLKLLKPDFTLKSDEDAHILQDAFDVLYPIDGQEDNAAKTIKHAGNTWTFVRGKFFEHLKGLIVTTDSAGKITSIKRSLEI